MEPSPITILIILAVILISISGYWFNRRLYINGKEVIISNNCFGFETISVDDNVVIKKFSFMGGRYEFTVDESKCEVEYYLRLLGLAIGITVRKDGDIIYSDK